MNDRWVIPTLHSARDGGKAESITLVSWIRLGGEFNRVVDWLAPPASSLYRMSPPTPSFVLASFKGSTYKTNVRLAFSLAAALLGDRFQHPVVPRPDVYYSSSSPLKLRLTDRLFPLRLAGQFTEHPHNSLDRP